MRRGGFETRPYGCIVGRQHDDPVNVIRHDHECVQGHIRVMIRQILPRPKHCCAIGIETHFTIHHLAEQTFPILGADRHKI
ncbi:MAG: hypothetical protein ACUVRV_06890, partial [Cyanobacteriota bacterium]